MTNGFAQSANTRIRAPTARNIIARGASPLVKRTINIPALKGRNNISAFQALFFILAVTRGDALRACPWLSYFAPLALWPNFLQSDNCKG